MKILHTLKTADQRNPFNNLVPDFTVFGAEFTELWQKVLTGIWGIALVVAAVYMVLGAVDMSRAGASDNPNQHKEGKRKFTIAGVGFAVLIAIGVITGAIITFVG